MNPRARRLRRQRRKWGDDRIHSPRHRMLVSRWWTGEYMIERKRWIVQKWDLW